MSLQSVCYGTVEDSGASSRDERFHIGPVCLEMHILCMPPMRAAGMRDQMASELCSIAHACGAHPQPQCKTIPDGDGRHSVSSFSLPGPAPVLSRRHLLPGCGNVVNFCGLGSGPLHLRNGIVQVLDHAGMS